MLGNHVITFHIIDNPSWWEHIVIGLKQRYNLIKMDDIESYYYNGSSLKRSCHITFDDGHKNIYENVFPLVKKHHIPISVYISPKMISERKNYWFQEVEGFEKNNLLKFVESIPEIDYESVKNKSLKEIFKSLPIDNIYNIISEYKKRFKPELIPYQNITMEQVLEMQESGLVTFGAHTVNHPVLPNETDEKAEYEIRTSIEWLSDLTGRRVIYWAFPNGDATMREVKLLRKHGIRLAFSTKFGTKFHRKADPLRIPRTGFTYGSRGYLFTKLILGKYWDRLRTLKNKVT